jgi:hypothetical protein
LAASDRLPLPIGRVGDAHLVRSRSNFLPSQRVTPGAIAAYHVFVSKVYTQSQVAPFRTP